MALVPIPPPRVGEYKLDVALTPRAGGGASALTLAISDPDTGTRVSRFIDVHERQLHLFVISKDLTLFEHIHPERRDDGTFAIEHSLPAGEYMLIADFLPAEGTSQVVQRAIVTPGYAGPIFVPAPTLAISPVEQSTSGLRIRLEHEPLRPRRESLLRFVVTDADSGLPATDLEPYLGAAGTPADREQRLVHGGSRSSGRCQDDRTGGDVRAGVSGARRLQDVGAVSAARPGHHRAVHRQGVRTVSVTEQSGVEGAALTVVFGGSTSGTRS